MTPDEFLQLSAEYAAGALEGEDLKQFEAYLKTARADELRDLAELLGTASLLPQRLERKTPPAEVRDRLLQAIRAAADSREAVVARTKDPGRRPVRQRTPRAYPWAPYALAFVVFSILVGGSLYVSSLIGTIEDQNQRLIELRNELERKEELLSVLSAKQVDMVIMNGLEDHPVGYGKIIWDPEKRVAILQVSNLPPVPTDKDYQLWVIKGGQPISAGIFSVSSTASYYFRIDQLAVTDPHEIAAFAVTLEPKGGVPSPTGTMYIAGSPRL